MSTTAHPQASEHTEQRAIQRVIRPIRTDEGPEFLVSRIMPQGRLPRLDPFMLFDEAGPQVEGGRANALGFVAHPHAGIVAVTYIVSDQDWEYRDTTGAACIQEVGSVTWMWAGDGVVHIERPTSPVREHGGPSHAFQLWVDLPNAQKKTAPRHWHVPATEVPEWSSQDGGAHVRLLSGSALGLEAVTRTPTPLLYMHLTLAPGAEIDFPCPASFNALAYPWAGALAIGADELPGGHFGVLSGGPHVRLSAPASADGPTDALFVAAEPHGQESIMVGPFIAESPADIDRYLKMSATGGFGTLEDDG